MPRHLTLMLDDSVTDTHCGRCQYLTDEQPFSPGPGGFGEWCTALEETVKPLGNPRRHPSCLENERDTKLTHDAAKVTLLGSGAPASTGKNHP